MLTWLTEADQVNNIMLTNIIIILGLREVAMECKQGNENNGIFLIHSLLFAFDASNALCPRASSEASSETIVPSSLIANVIALMLDAMERGY